MSSRNIYELTSCSMRGVLGVGFHRKFANLQASWQERTKQKNKNVGSELFIYLLFSDTGNTWFSKIFLTKGKLYLRHLHILADSDT